MSVLSLTDVRCVLSGHTVLNGLDWEVPQGAVFGLLGRNGAGKTTAIRVALGLLSAQSGQVQPIIPADFAYVPQTTRLLPDFTGRGLLNWLAPMYPSFDLNYGGRVASRLEVPLDRPALDLSVGQQRSLHAVLALAAQTSLLVLDEPAAGLDPVARRVLNEVLIERLSDDDPPTIVLSTHLLEDVVALADHVGIISGGRMALSGPVDTLLEQVCRVQVAFSRPVPPSFSVPDASEVEVAGRVWQAIVPISCEQAWGLTVPSDAHLDVFPLDLSALFIHQMALTGAQMEVA